MQRRTATDGPAIPAASAPQPQSQGQPASRGHLVDRPVRMAAMRKNNPLGLAIVLSAFACYALSLWATLLLPWWAAIPASVVNGIAIGVLFVIGHDACHLAFLETPRQNRILGRLVFLPSLTPFSNWHLIHNVRHHGHSNVRHLDGVWEPLSPQDFAASPRWRRVLYRFYRSHAGVFAYYAIDYWLRQFVLPRKSVLGRIRPVHIADWLLIWSYAAIVWGFIFWRAVQADQNLWGTAALSILLPLLVWKALMSITIYLQHTHPDIIWFASMKEWHARNGRVSTTAYVRIPRWMSIISLEMMEHPAHHYLPGVPVYNLRTLNQALPKGSYPSWTWTWKEHCRVVKTCKLYDYEAERWVGWDKAQAGAVGHQPPICPCPVTTNRPENPEQQASAASDPQ